MKEQFSNRSQMSTLGTNLLDQNQVGLKSEQKNGSYASPYVVRGWNQKMAMIDTTYMFQKRL